MKKVLVILMVKIAAIISAESCVAYELCGVDIHGFISDGYLSNDENNFVEDTGENSFSYGEIGINFSKDLNDNLRFGVQIFAKDFSDVSENEIVVDWAYADCRIYEVLGLRIGQIKFPHGLYNEIRDIDTLRTSIFLPDSVYHEVSYDLYANDAVLSLQGISSRDLYLSLQGIGIYGYIDLSIAGGLTYQAMYGTQKVDPNSNTTKRQIDYLNTKTPFINLSDSLIENDSVEVDYKYAGNLLWDTPLDGLRIGCSLDNLKMRASSRFTDHLKANINGQDITIVNGGEKIETKYDKLENWVFSAEYTWRNLILTAEYILTIKDYEVASDSFKSLPIGNAAEQSTATGWYVGGAYRFTDWLEFGGYYSQSNFDTIKDSNTEYSVYFFKEFRDVCATVRFDINSYWAIKFEAHGFKGSYPVNDLLADLATLTSTNVEEDWYMYTAKMTVAF